MNNDQDAVMHGTAVSLRLSMKLKRQSESGSIPTLSYAEMCEPLVLKSVGKPEIPITVVSFMGNNKAISDFVVVPLGDFVALVDTIENGTDHGIQGT